MIIDDSIHLLVIVYNQIFFNDVCLFLCVVLFYCVYITKETKSMPTEVMLLFCFMLFNLLLMFLFAGVLLGFFVCCFLFLYYLITAIFVI